MENGLTRMLSRVEHGAKTLFVQFKLLHEHLDRIEEVLKNTGTWRRARYIRMMLLGNDEHVDRGLWIDIAEGENLFGFQDFLTRQTTVDNFAEDAFTLSLGDFHFPRSFWTDHLRSERGFCQWGEFLLAGMPEKNWDQKLTAPSPNVTMSV